jgi:hypothetical protein
MLKVTFEFKTPEEAITAIAKIAGLGQAAPAPRTEIRKPSDIEGESRREPEPTKAERGQRADKGKKRGPYKARELTPEEAKAINDAKINKADDEARQAMQDKRDAARAQSNAGEVAAAAQAHEAQRPEQPPSNPAPETAAPAQASSTAPKDGVQATEPAAAAITPEAAQALIGNAPARTVASEADVQKALEKVFAAKQASGAMALLDKFGVKRGRDLPVEHRAQFIQCAEEACK